MSCSLTIDSVKARTKTVTRRHVDTWKNLKPGDHLTLIEKGMGLPKGAKQVVLAEVEIVRSEVEALHWVEMGAELEREGFPDWSAEDFMAMWAKAHGYAAVPASDRLWLPCRRIEWRYLT